MSGFRAPQAPFDIQKIMTSIEEQLAEDRPEEASDETTIEAFAETPSSATVETSMLTDDAAQGLSARLTAKILYLGSQNNLEPGRTLTSHRKFIGGLVTRLKRAILWGARPYVDAVGARQEAFNEANLQVLREIVNELQINRDIINKQHNVIEEQQHRISELKQQTQSLVARHDLGEFFESVPPEKRAEALNHSRGTFEDIQGRQQKYVDLFTFMPGQVLDVGCGRGEFLDSLHHCGIESWGAEIDDAMIEQCTSRGLHVLKMNALEALDSVGDYLLGGVFAAQVVEHMFPGDLLTFIQKISQKLAPGGRVILETLNPASLGVLAKSYYRDLDHKQPIHPEYLKDLLILAGFDQVELHYSAPFREDEKLPSLPSQEESGLNEHTYCAFKAQYDHLCCLLYGPQDFYVTALQSSEAVEKASV